MVIAEKYKIGKNKKQRNKDTFVGKFLRPAHCDRRRKAYRTKIAITNQMQKSSACSSPRTRPKPTLSPQYIKVFDLLTFIVAYGFHSRVLVLNHDLLTPKVLPNLIFAIYVKHP